MITKETADIVIIGGGIAGVSLAFFLAQRNLGRIVVLERETLGSGSTGLSVASIDLFSLQPAAVELQRRAYDIFAHFEEIVGESCGLTTTGGAVLAGPEQATALEQATTITQAAGIEAELLSPEAFAKMELAAKVTDLAAVCYVPAAGYGDPMLTTNAFAAAGRRAGVVIQQERPVTRLTHRGGRVTGVETTAGAIAAPVVVCAAGPWSGSILREFGLDDLGLQAVCHAVVPLQRPKNFGPPHLSILDLPHSTYARPESGGLTLAGSIDSAVGYDPIQPEAGPQAVSADYSFWVAERLVQRYPLLEMSELRPGWSGLMSITPDWQPVLGQMADLSGLYCAAGFSGQGFKISPAVGDLMAGLITGEAQAAELLAPFDPGRFADGRSLTSSGFVAFG